MEFTICCQLEINRGCRLEQKESVETQGWSRDRCRCPVRCKVGRAKVLSAQDGGADSSFLRLLKSGTPPLVVHTCPWDVLVGGVKWDVLTCHCDVLSEV